MRIVSWRFFIPLLLMAALVAVACGGEKKEEAAPAPAKAAATAAPKATQAVAALDRDQTLRVNLGGEPQSLDPQRATDVTSITILKQIYSTLVKVDENQKIVPDLAKEVPTVENGGISKDGLTYTYKLKDGIKWSDGKAIVAQDFVNGAKRLFEPGTGNYYVDFYRVLDAKGKNAEVEKALAAGKKGDELKALEQEVAANLQVTTPDEKTVVYKLSRPSPVFTLLTTMWPLYPVRQDVVTAKGDKWTEAGNLIANGAFTLKEWKHNENIVLEKNANWYQAADVKLTTVKFDMIKDSAVAFLAYQKGELDIVTLGPAELVQVRKDEKLKKEYVFYPQLTTIGVYFNLKYEPFKDVKVRQALAGSFNREEYAETVREGAVLPAYGWVPPGMLGHDDKVGLQYKDAVDKSKKLLADAGITDPKKITVEILTSDSSVSKLTAEWLKQQWEKNLGISVSIKVLERATYFSERAAGKYQVVTGGWGADYPDPQNWMPLFKSGGLLNSGAFADPEFDKFIDQADTELNNERRIALYKQSQVRMLDQMPFAPLNYSRRNGLVKPWVKGLITNSKEGDVPGDQFLWKISISGRSS
ncbi:MAG: peptide ABC transporter substrate-binding protein [Chloroflexi bacterium]|nr:peptide ABC transporter substrate-binding protein [Chloroflexota bacterium]